MHEKETISYYNENAESFISATRDVDFHETQDRFLKYIPAGGRILDFGCGSGRDLKYFMERGFETDATDGSSEMCKKASEFAGIPVRHVLFQDFDDADVYDGIWACSSILHLSFDELIAVFCKMSKALKDSGFVYTSFKYGEFEGIRNGRYFTDMTENRLYELLEKSGVFSVKELWITTDVRPGRGEEKWLNMILEKK